MRRAGGEDGAEGVHPTRRGLGDASGAKTKTKTRTETRDTNENANANGTGQLTGTGERVGRARAVHTGSAGLLHVARIVCKAVVIRACAGDGLELGVALLGVRSSCRESSASGEREEGS